MDQLWPSMPVDSFPRLEDRVHMNYMNLLFFPGLPSFSDLGYFLSHAQAAASLRRPRLSTS